MDGGGRLDLEVDGLGGEAGAGEVQLIAAEGQIGDGQGAVGGRVDGAGGATCGRTGEGAVGLKGMAGGVFDAEADLAGTGIRGRSGGLRYGRVDRRNRKQQRYKGKAEIKTKIKGHV